MGDRMESLLVGIFAAVGVSVAVVLVVVGMRAVGLVGSGWVVLGAFAALAIRAGIRNARAVAQPPKPSADRDAGDRR